MEKELKAINKVVILSWDKQGTSILPVVNVIYIQYLDHLPTLNATQLEICAACKNQSSF